MTMNDGRWIWQLVVVGMGIALGAGSVGCGVAPGEQEGAAEAAQVLAEQAGGAHSCDQLDPYEKNDKANRSTALAYTSTYSWEDTVWDHETGDVVEVTQFYATIYGTQANLCHKDEDWYHVTTSGLGSEYGTNNVYFHLRAMAAGASWCSATGDPELDEEIGLYDPPAGPENTLTVEVYNATTLDLLGSGTSTVGRVWLDLGGPNLGQDVLLRFLGPKQANYGYVFHAWAQSFDGEDECEY
jgi:hypothetical protein